jgi:hypothetical protein
VKIKRIATWMLTLCLIVGFFPIAALASPGSAEDPLISKSYVDESYKSLVLSESLELLKNSMTVLRYKLTQAAGAFDAQSNMISAQAGDSLSLSSGAGFTLLKGSASLSSLKGSLLDLTSGAAITGSQILQEGHRYLAAENSSATFSFKSDVSGYAEGSTVLNKAEAIVFADVPDKAWYKSYVYFAVSKGLVNGKSSTRYEPESDISYAETIKLAACMHQLHSTGMVSLENALSPNEWYDSYVSYAIANGIISGPFPNYDAKISRAEFVSIFYASMPEGEYEPINTVGDNKIPDFKITDKYAEEVYAFYRAGILIGNDGLGNFHPDTMIKRSEVAAVLTRMFEPSARKSIDLS